MAHPTGTQLRTRDVLWSDVEDIYASILDHPFLSGLADGTLPRESFRHYIVQDAHYLRGYARALALCAAKATDPADTVMFAEHAAGAIAAERDLHAALMHELGGSAEQAAREPVAPTTRAYVELPARRGLRRLVRRGGRGRAALLLDLRPGRRGAAGPQLTGPAVRALDRDVRRRRVPGRGRLGAGAHRPGRGRRSPRPSRR